METYGIPQNLEEVGLILPYASAAALFALLIQLIPFQSYGGLAPQNRSEWRKMAERLLATIALLFTIFSPVQNSASNIGPVIAFAAAFILLLMPWAPRALRWV